MIKEVNKTLEGYFIATAASVNKTSGGKPYLRITLADNENDIIGNIWDYNGNPAVKAGSVVYAKFTTENYTNAQGVSTVQAKNVTIRLATEDEKKAHLKEIMNPALVSDIPGEEMYQTAMKLIDAEIKDEDYRQLCKNIYNEYHEQMASIPGGKSVHHAYIGGLMEHCLTMAQTAVAIAPIYGNVANMSAVIAGCLLHDIAKIKEFTLGDIGIVSDYSVDGNLFGHLYMGAKYISDECEKINMPAEKQRVLTHMIVSHHGTPEMGAIKRPATAEASMLSYIDDMNARMNMFATAYAGIEPGTLTEKNVFGLDTRVYRPMWEEGATDVAVPEEVKVEKATAPAYQPAEASVSAEKPAASAAKAPAPAAPKPVSPVYTASAPAAVPPAPVAVPSDKERVVTQQPFVSPVAPPPAAVPNKVATPPVVIPKSVSPVADDLPDPPPIDEVLAYMAEHSDKYIPLM